MEGKVAVVNNQHHVSKGLEKGFLLQSGKINDIFKNLRDFTRQQKIYSSVEMASDVRG